MALTPAQKACVERLDGPLVVSAGAGSGKTFTLTHRIAHAFDVGYISDMDEVMAITYTTKAAEELKSRVKGVLRADGRIEQALKVDGAWISTIHGACSRILKEHALALGISPDFEVADEGRSLRLLDESIEEVLSSCSDLVTPEDSSGAKLDALFREYRPRSAGWDESSIEAMLRKLVTTASEDPRDMEVFVRPPDSRSPQIIAEDFLSLAKETLALAESAAPSASRDEFVDGTADAVQELQTSLGAGEVGADTIIGLINDFPKPKKTFGGKDVKDAMGEALEDYKALAMEARMAAAEPRLDELFDLAERTLGAYTARKQEAGLLDYGDLVALSFHALDEHPDIAQSYVDRFKLVMVDEFQDTDQVQVDLVGRLTGRDFGRLCTVGDEQQSIYRFRGADVSVYRRHLERVREARPDGVIELSDNFRSHPDILGFVERVFSREEAFGDSFLALSAARDEGRVARPFRGEGPRVQILLTTYGEGVGKDAAARVAAWRIAERFAEFRDAGQDPGDMVLLLGGMKRADVYAEELRRAGLPCVVTGGSIFSGSAEAKLVLRLAQVAADPHDQAALFEVLSSELFALSADDLLRLSTGEDPERGIPCRRSIDRGFQDLLGQLEAGAELPEALSCALRALGKLARGAGKVPSSKLVEGVLLDSGWLSRMEAQGPEGTARAANAYKAIRIMEDIEANESAGPARVARGLAERLDILRTPPGSLSAKAGGFVRIMTIHASKGLEFPIVAVAELRSSGSSGAKLLSSKVDDKIYLSLDAGESLAKACEDSKTIMSASSSYQPYEDFPGESTAEEVRTSASPAERRAAIKHREKEEGAAEDQRLLYVALTRAKEALVVSLLGKSSKTHPSGLSGGSGKLIEEALCPAGEAFCASPEEREGVRQYDFGGEQPARVEHLHLPSEGEKSEEEAAEEEAGEAGEAAEEEPVAQEAAAPEPAESRSPFQLMEVQPLVEAQDGMLPSPRQGVFSYSAISPHEAAAPATTPATAVDEGTDDDAAPRPADADRATDLGTAFHRLAQCAVDAKGEDGALLRPSAERQEALCRACGVSDAQRVRLDAALGRWFGSELCAEAAAWPQTAAEVPFFLQVRGPEGGAAADASAEEEAPCMEGEIDLLCSDPASSRALVIDYKTGGSPDETPEQLHEKHLLQARCYAYAVLSQGFGQVEARFVRVEQEDPARPGQPQVVGYSFAADELDDLGGLILEQYRASQGA